MSFELRKTIFSNFISQRMHRYSKIGIVQLYTSSVLNGRVLSKDSTES